MPLKIHHQIFACLVSFFLPATAGNGSHVLTAVLFPRYVQDGLAAVHWAAIKGHKEVLKFLIEGAPENNRADPLVVDKDNWSALMWAIFMAESAGKGEYPPLPCSAS